MTTKNGEHCDEALEDFKIDDVNIEEQEEEIPISPIVQQEKNDENGGAALARTDSNERREVAFPKSDGDYPWRDLSAEVGEENYDIEEPLFKDVNLTEKLAIWQVYNSKVSEVDETEHFKFYNDRAYIVLNIKPKDTKILVVYHHVHIWVSKHCSREDYQLAVARADQLSKKLDEKSFLHREIQLHETDAFHDHARILEVRRSDKDSSLRLLQFHVEGTAHRVNEKKGGSQGLSKRLKKRWMVEKKLLRGNLTSDDVFVLTNFGNFEIFQWNGMNSNEDEQQAAADYVKEESDKFRQVSKKHIAKVAVKEGSSDKNHRIYALFPHAGTKKKSRRSSVKGNEQSQPKLKTKKLYRLTYEKGDFMDRALETTKTVSKSTLNSNFVYLLDTDYDVYVWVGKEWRKSQAEKQLMLFFEAADRFLKPTYSKFNDVEKFHQPVNKPTTIVNEDDHCIPFDTALLH